MQLNTICQERTATGAWKTAFVNSSDYLRWSAFPNQLWCTLGQMKFLPVLILAALPFCVHMSRAQAASPQNTATASADDYSGMYTFLKDGEFMQVTIEDHGKVSGFISRFGDFAADKGTFLDQFFKSGRSDGNKLSFTTENVHGVWFTFEGTFGRGPGKNGDDEAYYVLRGTLTRSSMDADKKTTSQERKVEFKSFPRDAAPR
jgi:hypothetical protein